MAVRTPLHLLLLLLLTGLVVAITPLYRVSREAPKTGRYIIVLDDNVTDADFNETLRRAVLFSKDNRAYAVIRTIAKEFTLELNPIALQMVRQWSHIKSIEEESEAFGAQDSSIPWYLDRLDQISRHRDYQYQPIRIGKDIDVYILDSGINYDHEEFEKRAKYPGYDPMDEYDTGNPRRNGKDCEGHGTHVASLLGGRRFGAAKNVNLYSVRVLNCFNSAPWSVVIDGMDFVAKFASQRKRPAIVCMSLGGAFQPSANEGVKKLHEMGITVVVAAGNGKKDACTQSPASSPYVVTVGGTNSTDQLYWHEFSGTNYGSCVDILAPADHILGADYSCNNCSHYLSGTSMSTPLVGGIAALYLQEQALLTPNDVKTMLIENAANDIIDFSNLSDEQRGTTANKLLQISGNCGGTYPIRTSLTLISPNYPHSYPPNLLCQWELLAADNEDIAITITDLDIEKDHDYLLLCEGPGGCINGKISRHTGQLFAEGGAENSRKEIYYRTSNQNLTIQLHTDAFGAGRGFQLNFSKYYTNTPLKVPDSGDLLPKPDPSLFPVKTQFFIKVKAEQIVELVAEWKKYGYDILSVSVSLLPPDQNWYYDIIFDNSTQTPSFGFVELTSSQLNETIKREEKQGFLIHDITARLNGTTPLYSAVFRKENELIESHTYWGLQVYPHAITRINMQKKGWYLMSQHFLVAPDYSSVSAVYHRDRRITYNITIEDAPDWAVYYGFSFYYFTSISLDFAHYKYYPKHVSTYYYGDEQNARFSVIYESKQEGHPSFYRWFRWGLNSSEVYSEVKTFSEHWELVFIISYKYNSEIAYMLTWGSKTVR